MIAVAGVFLLCAAQDNAATERFDAAVPKSNPAPLCDDATFLKRVTRGLAGAEPTADELQSFLADNAPDKRARKIDALLASDRFSDHWAARFEKVFFNDRPPDLLHDLDPAAPARFRARFVEWFRDQLRQDRPYNQIVFDMLDARGTSANPPLGYKLSFFRGLGFASEFAQGITRQLTGIRLHCARCHNHPFDRWEANDYAGMAAFNARQRARVSGKDLVELREESSGEYKDPQTGKETPPKFFLGGGMGQNDARPTMLATYMTSKGNHWLSNALVNRVLEWLLGRGAVDPVDDFNDLSISRARALWAVLQGLTKEFTDHAYSIKFLARTICNSKTYQRADPTEPAPAGSDWIWHGTLQVKIPGPFKLRKPPPDITFSAPAGWLPGNALWTHCAPPPHHFVQDKERKERDAHFNVVRRDNVEGFMNQMSPGIKRAPEVIQDSQMIKLWDIAGFHTCATGSLESETHRMLIGRVTIKSDPWTFLLVGPEGTVSDWREEFIALLKSVAKPPPK